MVQGTAPSHRLNVPIGKRSAQGKSEADFRLQNCHSETYHDPFPDAPLHPRGHTADRGGLLTRHRRAFRCHHPRGDHHRGCLLPIGEDDNLGGDLDITEPVTVHGLGDDFIWWDDPATPEVEALDVFNDPDGFPHTFVEADLPDVGDRNEARETQGPGGWKAPSATPIALCC